jgi:4-aminobutyrate aminotransferase
MPLAAVVARDALDVAHDRALGHYTHEKSPLACAAGMAAINYIESNHLLEHVCELGDYSLDRLHQLKAGHRIIKNVRGIGLLLGIELILDGKPAADEAEAVMYEALSRGLSFKLTMGNILTLTPALTITRDEMKRALDIIAASIDTVEKTI